MSVESVSQASTTTAQASKKPTNKYDGKVDGKWSSKELGDIILDLKTPDAVVLKVIDDLVSDKDVSPNLVSLVEKYVGMRSVRATTKSGIIQAIIETLRNIARNIGR